MKEKKNDFITARLTSELKKKIEAQAENEDRSTSYIINKILEEHFKNEERESN